MITCNPCTFGLSIFRFIKYCIDCGRSEPEVTFHKVYYKSKKYGDRVCLNKRCQSCVHKRSNRYMREWKERRRLKEKATLGSQEVAEIVIIPVNDKIIDWSKI